MYFSRRSFNVIAAISLIYAIGSWYKDDLEFPMQRFRSMKPNSPENFFSMQTTQERFEICPKFTSITSHSVVITWKISNPETKFQVSIEESDLKPFQIIEGSISSVKLEELNPSTRYTVTITSESDNFHCKRSVITLGRENYVSNPSFEYNGNPIHPQVDYGEKVFASFWEPVMMAYELTKDTHRKGEQSLRISSSHPANKWGASQYVFLNQSTTKTLVFGGWSSSLEVSGKIDDGYALLLDIKFKDGTRSYAHNLQFPTGSHEWVHRCALIPVEQEVESASIFVIFAGHTGTVWFDDVYVSNIEDDEEYNDCELHEVKYIPHGFSPRVDTIYAETRPDSDDVSLVSQMTPDRLPILLKVADHWKGPICVAVLINDISDVEKVEQTRSSSRIRNFVDFHLVYAEKSRYAISILGLYPVNSLRNIAIEAVRTEYVLVLDIDFIPSLNAHTYLRSLIPDLQSWRTVFVVPAFEMDEFNHGTPDDKQELLQFAANNKIRQVHKDKWQPAHAPTNYDKWFNTTNFYEIFYAEGYEPYILARKDIPRWDERFVGYGYDKVSHTLELHEAGYRFVAIPDAFIIHWDHGVPKWRDKGEPLRVRVWQNYLTFLEEISMKYKTVLPEWESTFLSWGISVRKFVVMTAISLFFVFVSRFCTSFIKE